MTTKFNEIQEDSRSSHTHWHWLKPETHYNNISSIEFKFNIFTHYYFALKNKQSKIFEHLIQFGYKRLRLRLRLVTGNGGVCDNENYIFIVVRKKFCFNLAF